MRLAFAQVDAVVGDIECNASRAIDAIRRAEDAGADLTLLPELMLTGYPPEDLLAKDHFVDDNLSALQVVAGSVSRRALIGFVERGANGRLHNASALLGQGRVLGIYRKRRLPNYGVFDEARYFEPGGEAVQFEHEGVMAACTVCEDIWVPELATQAAASGARLLLNISASPFDRGKGESREAMLRRRATENGVWLAYCNLVGGQDELVFDGRSVLISPEGEVVARAKAFEEDLLIAEFPAADGNRIEPLLDGEEEVYRALTLGLRDYIHKNEFTDVVIGMSGGIDSALTAVLAADALGAEHVHGVTMPSRYSSEGSRSDSQLLAEALGMQLLELPIERPFDALLDDLTPVFAGLPPDITEENLQARIRGILLMALSNKFGWIVLATGNKSELSVGYSTLYGDMVGGFAPIKDVFKTRVYDLARWRNERGAVIPDAILTKPPSAELRPGQVDQDSLPPYDVLDGILVRYVERDESQGQIVAAGFDEAIVARVCHLVDAAEYKRRQGPTGIRITPKAFGKDRRMPITNRYRG